MQRPPIKPLLEHAAAEAEARRLVNEALETGADTLVLDGLRINRLPDGLRALAPQLKRLSLWGCRRISDLAPLRELGGLQELNLGSCEQVSDLSVLPALADLRTLDLAWCGAVGALPDLRSLVALQTLDLTGHMQLRDLSALRGLTSLCTLSLNYCISIEDLSALSALSCLQSLDLSGCGAVQDMQPLAALAGLRALGVRSVRPAVDWRVLASLSVLESLDLYLDDGAQDLSPMAALSALKSLQLFSPSRLVNLTAIRELSCLEHLHLGQHSHVNDWANPASLTKLQSLKLARVAGAQAPDFLASLTALQRLTLSGCDDLVDLSPLASLAELRHLALEYCPSLPDLSLLEALPRLESLAVIGCPRIADFTPLQRLVRLESLHLSGCERFSDLSMLQGLVNLQTLDLSLCAQLTEIDVLGSLGQLRDLDLFGCQRLGDISAVQSLSKLQRLNISGCDGVADLSPLANLSGLESLSLSRCGALLDLSPLLRLKRLRDLELVDTQEATFDPAWVTHSWPWLQHLACTTARAAPRELQTGDEFDDCLPQLERWLADLATSGSAPSNTVKLFVLGNGRAGKTQIVRRLQGLPFDDSVASTHGVRTAQLPLLPDIGLNAQVWDFGGQDIYLGTHSLFLDDRAIYLLVWTPSLENADTVVDSGIEMRNKRLSHWLAHVRAMVGPRAPVLVVQSQCDRESQRVEAPVPEQHGFDWLQRTACSAHQPDGLDRLWPEFRAAARLLQERHGDVVLPRSWVAVRDQLRNRLQQGTQVLPRAEYDTLCETQDVGAPDATLAYLHQAGDLFSLPGVFNGDVVLDQAWALGGLYALLHRQQVLPVLRQYRGHFTRELLGALIWDAQGFNADEQANFLSMMQRCGVCFSLGDGHYLAPDCLPALDAVQPRVDALWRGQAPAVQVTLAYPYLHDGLLRTLVSKLGEKAGLEAVYWRYGMAFYDAKAGTAVQIDCRQSDDPQQPFAGTVTLSVAELHGRDLLKKLVKMLIDVAAMAEAPEQRWSDGADAPSIGTEHRRHPDSADGPRGEGTDAPVIDAVQPPVAPGALAAVHVSYAWGGESERWVDALEQALDGRCTWRRDKGAMRPGDWISTFMDEIADARCVVVVVSDKSLKSPYCMRELLGLFQTSNGHKNRVLERIVPVVMPDAAIDTTPQRMARVRYWKEVYDTNVTSAQGLDAAELGQEFVHEQQLISEFRTRVADILKWVSDVLMPRPGMPGAEASVQAVAAAVQQRLDH